MRSWAESFISRIVAAARPARPWLHINASPRVALFLVAAGARPGRIDLHNADLSMKSLTRANLRVADLRVARLAEYAGDQSDADLDAMLAAAGDRLLTAVQASLDLDAGLAEIIGDPPWPGMPGGDDELAGAGPGERRTRMELLAGSIRADSAEGRYLAGPGKPFYRHVAALRAQEAAAAAKAARLATDSAKRADEKREGRHRSRVFRLLFPAMIFLGTLRVSWKRRRHAAAACRLAMIQERVKTAADQLQQDLLNFLLKTEGLPFGLAWLRASSILEITTASDNVGAFNERHSAVPVLLPRSDAGRHPGRRRAALAAAAAATAIAAAFTGLLIIHHANDARHAALAAQTGSFPPVNLDDCPTLHSGYPGGGCVAQLQTDLNIAQGSHLVVDGSFGPVGSRTYNAVIAFQGAHGLPQNGMVGPDMKKALKAALSGSSVSRPRP